MSGFGGLLKFELDGSEVVALTVLNNPQPVDISNNLGDSESLVCHPDTTIHFNVIPGDRASLDISRSHILLLVGLDDADDLIEALDQGWHIWAPDSLKALYVG